MDMVSIVARTGHNVLLLAIVVISITFVVLLI